MRTFDFGIKEFKRLLKQNPNLTRSDRNKAVKAYKARIKERMQLLAEGINKKQGIVEAIDNGDEV